MNRRDFLKAMTLAGAAVVVDLKGAGKALAAQSGKNNSAKGDLVAIMGGEPDQMLRRALQELGGIEKFVKKGQKVVIKPNIGWNKTPELAANTNPVLVGELVRQCVAAGAAEVVVFDHATGNMELSYKNSGIKDAVESNGGKMAPSNSESYYVETMLPKGIKLKSTKIHKAIVNCDVWINVPVLKHHGGAKFTCCLKNYMGINWDRKVMHNTDLQQCIADLATWPKKPVLNIVDAYRSIVNNGPQGKGPDDVYKFGSLIASADIVAADTAAMNMFSQVRKTTLDDASHIRLAESHKLGTTDLGSVSIKRIRL